MVETKDNEIYELKCEICGKVIRSLSENQADYNMKSHMITHGKLKIEVVK